MKNLIYVIASLVLLLTLSIPGCDEDKESSNKRRVFVLSDIGGSDPDDIQSAIHMLTYADTFTLEGFIASTPRGNISAIHEVINAYEKDYQTSEHLAEYPTPAHLRSVVRQGATQTGVFNQNEGTKLLIERARAKSSSKLNVIVWGSLTDVATALQVAPDIADKINVISLGAWNTRQDRKAHSVLWNMRSVITWTDINTTFRAMYKGWPLNDNKSWVNTHIRPRGALGKLFYDKSVHIDTGSHSIKMGDTPTFFIALLCNPENPTEASCWGGQYRNKYAEFPKYFTDITGQVIDGYAGGGTINRHRGAFLADFANRLKRFG